MKMSILAQEKYKNGCEAMLIHLRSNMQPYLGGRKYFTLCYGLLGFTIPAMWIDIPESTKRITKGQIRAKSSCFDTLK